MIRKDSLPHRSKAPAPLLAMLLWHYPCFGQAEAPLLEEVMVSAQHRSESIQDVAIGMSAVSGEDLERQGITSFEDLNKSVAGLHAEAESGFASASLRIRGVGTAGFSIVDPSVGVLIDGVYQSRIGTAFADLIDIERVEVLRGPQGTLFGKNTTAGVIKVETRRPDMDALTGRLQGTVGNFDAMELRAALNVPLIDNVLASRFSAYSVDREGHNVNETRDIDTRGADRHGWRAKLLYTPTDNLDIYLIGDYKSFDEELDRSLARYGTYDNRQSTGGIPAPVPAPGVDPQGRPLEDVAAEQGKPLQPVSAFSGVVYEDGSNALDGVFEAGTLQIDWQLPGHLLTSISGYQLTDEAVWQDSDGTALALMDLFVHSIVRTKTQELRLASYNGGLGFDYVVGLFYQSESVNTNVTVFDGEDAAAIERRQQREDIPVTTKLESEALAAFGHLTYPFGESWEGVVGLRHSRVEKSANSSLILRLPPPTSLLVPENISLIPNLSEDYSETTFTAKLKHYLNANRLLYVSLDRGFKTGGFNLENVTCPVDEATCLPESQTQYDPELTHSAEFGWKTEWLDNRLRLNGAVFYQIYEDFQVNVANPRGSIAIVSNASDLTSKGLELDATAALTARVTVNASMAWIRASYDKYDNAPCATSETKSPACTQDLSGEQLDNSPEWTGNLGMEYTWPGALFDDMDWFIRGDAVYRGGTFLLGTQASDTFQSAYTVYSLRTGLSQAEGTWKAELWANNLTDEDYGVVATRPALHIDGLNLVRGLPRTYGLTFEISL